MAKFFWQYPVTCNAACHAKRGVGHATDYAVPMNTTIHAPFAGAAQSYWTDKGGWGVRLVGTQYTFCGQHLAQEPKSGNVEWRQPVAVSGNTGSATTGPHIHAYIIVNRTGERMSFQKWYEDVLPGGSAPIVPPKPKPPVRKTFRPPAGQAYWYTSRADANAMRNVHGNGNGKDKRYTNEPMLIGSYPVISDPGDSFAVRTRDGSTVWVSRRLRNGIK